MVVEVFGDPEDIERLRCLTSHHVHAEKCPDHEIVIEPDEDGVFVAECPALPGCISQGKTRAEAEELARLLVETTVGPVSVAPGTAGPTRSVEVFNGGDGALNLSLSSSVAWAAGLGSKMV